MPHSIEDPFNLQRFIDAQKSTFEAASEELRKGRKTGHWIWYIFPQLQGLGRSAMSQEYGIASLEEARAYVTHPTLGPRLREITSIVNAIEGRTIHEIFGYPDDMKFRSSMTLFARATQENAEFVQALQKYFAGQSDQLTVSLL